MLPPYSVCCVAVSPARVRLSLDLFGMEHHPATKPCRGAGHSIRLFRALSMKNKKMKNAPASSSSFS